MIYKITLLIACIFFLSSAGFSQSITPKSDAYNWPYDSLTKQGQKGVNSGRMLGVKSPALGVMFYNRAIEINKARPEAYDLKGQAYLAYDMLEEALESYSAGLETNPDNPDLLYGVFSVSNEGRNKYEMNDIPKPMMKQIQNSAFAFLAVAPPSYKNEIDIAKEAGYYMKLASDNLDAYKQFNLNDVKDKTEDNIKAIENLIPAVALTKNNPMLGTLYDKLVMYYAGSNYAKVKELALKAIATGEARISTYYYYASDLYRQEKNAVEAVKMCDEGLKQQPANMYLRKLKSTITETEGKAAYAAKDYVKAAANLKKYVEINSSDERALALLAFSNYNLKKYPDAAKNFTALKKLADPATVKIFYPNLDALLAFASKPGAVAPVMQTTLPEVEEKEKIITKAIALFDEKKYDESIATLNSVLPYFETTKNPIALSAVYYNLGAGNHNSKKYDEAKSFYRKSIAVGGTDAQAYAYLGMLLRQVDKNLTETEKILNEGLNKFPDEEAITGQLAKLYSAQGDTAYGNKDNANAITYFLKSLDYDENARTYAWLGFSYYANDQDDEAKEALENAKSVDPDIVTNYPKIDEILTYLNR